MIFFSHHCSCYSVASSSMTECRFSRVLLSNLSWIMLITPERGTHLGNYCILLCFSLPHCYCSGAVFGCFRFYPAELLYSWFGVSLPFAGPSTQELPFGEQR